VALVCGGYQPRLDGVSDYVRRLVTAFGSRIEPILVSAGPVDADGCAPVIARRGDWRIGDILLTLRELRRHRVDLVHVQHAPVAFRWRRAPQLLPLVARALLGRVPVVVTAHEFEPDMLRLVSSADAAVVTTPELAQRIRQAAPGVAPRLHPIPIGPNVQPVPGDPARLAAEARRRWSVPPDAPLVVFFGFLHPVKGLEYLLRGMARVRSDCRSVCLIVAGGWRSLALPGNEGDEYRDRLLRIMRDCHLEDAVRLTGYLAEADGAGVLMAADVVTLPLTYGISLKSGSLLAALAHARAVVAMQPALADPRLRPGEHLVCVAPRQSEPLGAAILGLLEDPTRRRQVAEAGASAARPFNWRAIAESHLQLYARLPRRDA
jgi:glycosyltransferase involved in cell wall biosynthesis